MSSEFESFELINQPTGEMNVPYHPQAEAVKRAVSRAEAGGLWSPGFFEKNAREGKMELLENMGKSNM